ncbi:PREDICTED: transmembrane protein PVRIG [Condylura cristata]|uniref:transmembrane protein PVRIG n=1 Tax=Condylura cristata TaxID=143302 RepID=UPI0006428C2C|nr:PREDICTED: transmembrane protein PVRIG [Condylura cristata]
MCGAPAPVLLLALLTLCITAGAPEVWVQVQMEDTNSLSFTIRCGFLGSGSISLATVNSGDPEDAEGTLLAVLHPELGTELHPPTRKALWETRTSILLILEEPEGRSFYPNTTFCCKFISYPEGSQKACETLPFSKDKGNLAPEAVSMLRADLAGIAGASAIILLGCIYLLYLLHRQRQWSAMKLQPAHSSALTQTRARMVSQASLASLHTPYATVSNNYVYPPTMDTVPLPQLLSWGQGHASSSPLSPGQPGHPQLTTVSSPWKMDSMIRLKKGLSTADPPLSLSITLWDPEALRGGAVRGSMRDTQVP